MARNALNAPALAELDDWTDEDLRGFVRRHLRNDDAWTWEWHTARLQVVRLRDALHAVNGELLDAARDALHRMTPVAFNVWARENRTDRDAVDLRLRQVRALPLKRSTPYPRETVPASSKPKSARQERADLRREQRLDQRRAILAAKWARQDLNTERLLAKRQPAEARAERILEDWPAAETAPDPTGQPSPQPSAPTAEPVPRQKVRREKAPSERVQRGVAWEPGELQPRPDGVEFNFTAEVARLSATGMLDREIGAIYKVSSSHIRKVRKMGGIESGRYRRRADVDGKVDPRYGLPYGTIRASTAVHLKAREIIGKACRKCGKKERVHAALRPDTPRERLLVSPQHGSMYSEDPTDYFALCPSCHRRLDVSEGWVPLPEAELTARQRAAKAWGGDAE